MKLILDSDRVFMMTIRTILLCNIYIVSVTLVLLVLLIIKILDLLLVDPGEGLIIARFLECRRLIVQGVE